MSEICRQLSIVVPTLNAQKHLRMTLESLLPIKDAGAKIVVVDSHSQDCTLEVAQEYTDLILQFPKGNMYAAINHGIASAETKWVGYLNADDIVYSDAFFAAFAAAEAGDFDLAYGDVDFIDQHSRFLHSYRLPEPGGLVPLAASAINGVSPIGTFFTKSLWHELKGFSSDFRYSADFDFFLRAAMAGKKFYKLKAPTLGAFRLHGGQLSQEVNNPVYQESLQIINRLSLNVDLKTRLFHKWLFKAENIWEYLIRILRRRRLTQGREGLAACIEPPRYQS